MAVGDLAPLTGRDRVAGPGLVGDAGKDLLDDTAGPEAEVGVLPAETLGRATELDPGADLLVWTRDSGSETSFFGLVETTVGAVDLLVELVLASVDGVFRVD